MHFRYVSLDVSVGDMVFLFGGITIPCLVCLVQRDNLDSRSREGRKGTQNMVESKKSLHTTPQQDLQLFSFPFFTFFLRKRETIVLFEKESLEKGKCACLIFCKEWGAQEGKIKFSGLKRQQSGFLVLQYTWWLSQHCCKIIHVYVK